MTDQSNPADTLGSRVAEDGTVPQKKRAGRPKGSKGKPKWKWIRVRVDSLPRNPVGAPSKYTKRIARKILYEISTTTRSLNEICEANPEFPRAGTIYAWLMKKPEFCELYDRAKQKQAQLLAEQIVIIADTPKMGQITTTSGKDKDGRPIVKEVKIVDMTEHRKLQVDVRKWMAARLLPKKYGERLEVADSREPLKDLIDSLNAQAGVSPKVQPETKDSPPEIPAAE